MNQSMIKKLLYSVLLLCSQWALAQTDIKGTVTDAKGEPLLGATVILKERNVGVTTDMEGKFTIKGEQGQTLEVSYVGFQMKKVKITSNNLKITLQEETEQLGEVVVTGYQKIKSRVFTGASASVKMNEIKMDGVADVSRMLEGRVAGLSIQKNRYGGLTIRFGTTHQHSWRGFHHWECTTTVGYRRSGL
ncbi:exported hypothetical protein [Capnocytophaga canimorsus]|uniref:TonB-linked outer membrane protein, SusC/RagA family n=1 Tax=Capnocytophaga canimorsus TaxID=28188 RepID=A0A0B7H482_9FLAO|nr:exported hypothetical protein [Capnocytophaga canimorsus]